MDTSILEGIFFAVSSFVNSITPSRIFLIHIFRLHIDIIGEFFYLFWLPFNFFWCTIFYLFTIFMLLRLLLSTFIPKPFAWFYVVVDFTSNVKQCNEWAHIHLKEEKKLGRQTLNDDKTEWKKEFYPKIIDEIKESNNTKKEERKKEWNQPRNKHNQRQLMENWNGSFMLLWEREFCVCSRNKSGDFHYIASPLLHKKIGRRWT